MDTVKAVLADVLEVTDIPQDSLAMLDLALAIEDHFDICLTQSELAKVKTVDDLVQLVESKLQ